VSAERFELRLRVRSEDIDELGHVNNVVYLRWVQEAAVAHWRAAAAPRDQASLHWVVIRHEIDYKRPAMADDEIVAATWVGGATRRVFERHTELRRAADGKVLARALTQWCPIDAETGKPTDVSDDVRRRFSVPREG
jgi:acyl-CoA thioester hydrolase